ncbi:cupin domain-containing protein [Flavisphingomonas formosensis]|uniref:cupin domain-containing protein n=1 Tax=Flavisphingomonas formosensis TaxID=861534 RepID=UPI0012F8BEE1|nr:cupin domain-containing protein [Sphingomonas formosensis]
MRVALTQAVAAVVDVRAYAAGTNPSDDWFDGRAAPAFADRDAQVAAIALRGAGRVQALPADEFVLILEGRLEIEGEAGTLPVDAGTGAVLPIGSSFAWRASDDLLAVIYSAPTTAPGNATKPLAIDHDAPLAPSNPPLAENLIGPTPACRSHSDYISANGEFACGIWDSTPYHRRQIPYRQVELMYLLDGKVSFADAHGSVSFSAGDVCLFVRGDGCAWLSEEYVRKIYANQRPAG